MTNTRISQVSFSRGELCPPLYNRTDIEQYSIGLKTLKNGFVHQEGCVSNRFGLEFVGEVKDSTKKTRLIPFVFNSEQTYIIEAGDEYFRFIQDGGYIVYPDDYGVIYDGEYSYINSGTNTNNEIYYEYNLNDIHYFSSSLIELNSILYTDNLFENEYGIIEDIDTEELNIIVADSDKITQRGEIVEISTPYKSDDLQRLKFAQSGDILTITHINYSPKELSRYDHHQWSLEDIVFSPSIEAPTDITINWSTTTPASNKRDYTYLITAVDERTLEESGRSVTVTATGHREAYWTTDEFMALSWSPVEHALEYNIYRSVNGIFGYIGTAKGEEFAYKVFEGTFSGNTTVVNSLGNTVRRITLNDGNSTMVYTSSTIAVGNLFYSDAELSEFFGKCDSYTASGSKITLLTRGGKFIDDNIEPDMTETAPELKNPFDNGNNPSCCAYYQQRKIYANTLNSPQTIYASQTATSNNFNSSRPLIASDAIEIPLADREVNEIVHLIPFKDLIALTTNSEYKINGSDGKFEANPMPVATIQSSYGSSHVQPVVSGNMVLFVEAGGTVLRELGYDYLSDSYDGDELSLFASHLFEGKEIIYIAYAKAPYRIVFVVMNDGSLATLTYNKKQKLCGWGRQETDGKFESVAVIREGAEDVAYFIIKRTINNQEVRYVERTKTRIIKNAKKGFLVDCGLSAHFDTAVTTISGLNHLINKEVMVLADGGVIHDLTVSNSGTIVLPKATNDIVVGLPYEFELETLGVEGENTHGLKKQINAVTINILNSREDFFVVGNQGHETQLARSINSINDSGYLYSGKKDATPLNTPTDKASIHIKQKYPLPLTISSVSAIVNIEDISDAVA